MIEYTREDKKYHEYKGAIVEIENKSHPIYQILPLYAATIYTKSKTIYNDKIAKALDTIQKSRIIPVFPPENGDQNLYKTIENCGYEIGFMDHDLNKIAVPESLQVQHEKLLSCINDLKQTNFVSIEDGIVSTPLTESEFEEFHRRIIQVRNTYDQFKNACFWITILNNCLADLCDIPNNIEDDDRCYLE